MTLERYIAIDDYGRLINPMLTAGQVQGGLAQGIGQALLERTVYDDDIRAAPERLADGLRAAARRRSAAARGHARRRADRDATRSASRARGRPGASAAPQTIVHAILDALAPLGIEHIEQMPAATPNDIGGAICDSRKASGRGSS